MQFVSNLRPAEIVGALPPAHSKDLTSPDRTMRANVEYHGLGADWTRVTDAAPCPVCGGFGQCGTHVEEELACCVEEPSEWRLQNGGWLHRMALAPAALPAPLARLAGEQRLTEPLPSDASPGVVS
jgi:hypothetical protein